MSETWEHLSELMSHCIRCGFCLESCPTFAVTGNELESPRGRIYLVRSATEGKLDWQEDVKPHLDLCLGCRGCETACPSGVKYGEILEIARDKIESDRPTLSRRMLLEVTTHPGILKAQLGLTQLLPGQRLPNFMSRILSGANAEADLPKPQIGNLPPLDESKLPPVKGEIYFLEGCAMRVLYPRVHESAKRLLRRIGYRVKEVGQGCCGALHAHNGYLNQAAKMATELMDRFREPLPVVVDSAGCGSTMKEYGSLLPQESALAFSGRVFDLSEFLLRNGLRERLAQNPPVDAKVAYHEACHLVHGQRVSAQPKELLAAVPGLNLTPFPEADMCCGSAGIYNVVEPEMARKLLERKWENLEGAAPDLVATGNPGCHAWIAQGARERGGRIEVLHTAEVLEASFIGLGEFVPNRSATEK